MTAPRPIASLGRYWRTLRHLKATQIVGRLWFKAYRGRPIEGRLPGLRQRHARWPGPRLRRASLVGAKRIRLLNDEREIGSFEAWRSAHADALWLYNLHYFHVLESESDCEQPDWQRGFVRAWLDAHQEASGLAWDPYPLSLRIVNWSKWLLRGEPPETAMLASLAVQARFLRGRLEWHLLGNHLLVNAKALVFAGAFFEGREADAWLRCGLAILRRQLEEQILDDGGHFELSPMYHALILEDVLDLLALAVVFPGRIPGGLRGQWRDTARAMLSWLDAMSHPDGEISLFNDAAFGVAASPGELHSYAGLLGIVAAPTTRVRDLSASGYARIERGPAILLADIAPLGPDYLPAHGHADTLSFELSLFGDRLVVDSGTSQYGISAERLRQRGSAAHNTVVVDDRDSSEVWGGFRVGRRARVVERVVRAGSSADLVCGAHDGYRGIGVIHRRTWRLDDESLEICDELDGDGTHEIEWRLHLSAESEPRLENGSAARLTWGREGRLCSIDLDPQLEWSCDRGSVHLEFGRADEAPVLSGYWRGEMPRRFTSRIIWGKG